MKFRVLLCRCALLFGISMGMLLPHGSRGAMPALSFSLPHLMPLLVKKSSAIKLNVEPANHFEFGLDYGNLRSILWRPSAYPKDGINYDVFYYLPESLKGQNNIPVMIFLHGGGASTTTREGSAKAIKMYEKLLIDITNRLNVALIVPSASGLNWGTHTSFYMRALINMLKESLPIDTNRVGLVGHSMGGMAITRNFYELADLVSFAMPMAAGIAELIPEQLMTLFNLRYDHLQGLNDQFDVFVERTKNQQKIVRELEIKYQQESKFTVDFTQDDHSSVLNKMLGHASTLYQTPRDEFPAKLYGIFNSTPTQEVIDVGQKITVFPKTKYFWLEALEFAEPTVAKHIAFIAEAKSNQIDIQFKNKNEVPKVLKVYTSEKLFDFSQPIFVYVQGRLVHVQPACVESKSACKSYFDFTP